MHRRALLSALVAAPVVAACGTTEPQRAPGAGPSTPAADAPVSATDSRGRTITLPRPAIKVVTLEWAQTEDVVTLGVQPIGVADPKGYASWNKAAPLPGSPVDVGVRREPSLESIARLAPDLILGAAGSIPEAAIAQAEKIAPVVLLTPANATSAIQHMKTNHTTIATLLGKKSQAEKVLGDFDAALQAGAGRLTGKKYVFTATIAQGNNVSFRMHSATSLPGAVAKGLGLVNVWQNAGDAAYGIGNIDLEGFSKLDPEMSILYWGNSDSEDQIKGALATNPLWANLDAVKKGRVHRVADGTWMYGGPASMRRWIDELVRVLG